MWVPPFVFIGPQAPLPVGGQRSGLVGTPPEVGVRTGPQASSTEVQHGWLRLDPAPHVSGLVGVGVPAEHAGDLRPRRGR